MTVYPNFTLLIQIINFLILVFILNRILYKPIRNILRKREQEFNNLNSLIERIKGEVQEKERSMEEIMLQARKLGFMEKESLKEEANKYEKELLKETYTTVEEKLSKAKEELQKKLEDIQKELQKDVIIFSQEVAERILGRGISK
ncbi:MAG: hypothetical protein DRG39_03310 [Deltaproteobacteria bacterium]|nr:MAG: hypothetical protein DRG39_03310 [Deltaproteobacteria bacterium]